MGEGDSKLLLMIGAFVGWQGALFALFAGAAQGLLTYLLTRIPGLGLQTVAPAPHEVEPPAAEGGSATESESHSHADEADLPPSYWGHLKLPFGPFLALGALEYLFFGDAAIDAWFRLVQGAG
jgi:leader peptidase (prepilin peptidase)/N-methyltransferase